MSFKRILLSMIGFGLAAGLAAGVTMSTTSTQAGVLPEMMNHFKCYKAAGTTLKVPVALTDQFIQTAGTVIKPQHFCNPVDKNGEGIPNPDFHLTCYKITVEQKTPTLFVGTQNQYPPDQLKVTSASFLCVPTMKASVQEG